MDVHTMHQERDREKAMADVRRDITSQFKEIAIDLEQQIEEQLRQFESQEYGQLEKNVAEARQQTASAMEASHSELGQLATIRKKLELIIREVRQAAMPSMV